MPEFVTTTGSIFYEVIAPTDAVAETPTVTLLHNFMSTGRSAWGPLIEKLARRFRLLLPDLPGHGRSQGYPPAFHYGMIAQQIADLLVAEQAADGHLAGCSAGGMIAQLLVNRRLVQPASLTLVSTTYSMAPQVTDESQKLKPENFQAGRRWMEATAQLHDPHHYPGYYAEVLLASFRCLEPATTIDLTLADLSAWTLPVCLIHGTEDEFFPPLIVEQMATTLSNAELHLLPGQPHALIFRQPWKVAELMATFLHQITQQ